MWVSTGTTDFTYASSLCEYILSEDWDDPRPVRMIGTVTGVGLDSEEAALVRESVCDVSEIACRYYFDSVLEVTVEHDFDGRRHPGMSLYLLAIGPGTEHAREIYEGHRLMFFGKILRGNDPLVAIAIVPAMFTERNCYVFAPDNVAITRQFGESPVTEAEMASLVEETLRVGVEACNERTDNPSSP